MKMFKMLILAGMVLAGLGVKSNATISFSTSSVQAIVIASTPTVSGQLIRIKGCNLGNGLSVSTCVNLIQRGAAGDTTKAILCAGAGASATFPASAGGTGNMSGTPGAMSQFFGEDLTITGGFVITSSTPSASSITTCAYVVK